MKFLCLTLITAYSMLFYTCTPSNKSLKGVKLLNPFPFFSNTGYLEGYDTSIAYIYYYKDKVMYSMENKWIHTENGNIVDHGIDTSYLVMNKGNKEGYYYDKWDKQFGIRKNLDTAFKASFITHKDFAELLTRPGIKEISNVTNQDGSTKEIIYTSSTIRAHVGEISEGKTDSIIYYFSNNFKNVPFSLSPRLDSLSSLKLCKVKIICSPIRLSDTTFVYQRFEGGNWLEELKIEDPKPVLFYFSDAEKRENKH